MDRIGSRTAMRQAVIDIGTNTCLLLIAESNEAGEMKVLADIHAIARLGAGVDKSKRIQPEAVERLKNILLSHKKVITDSHAEATTAIATSAMRDAQNREEIIATIKEECSIDIELLSGKDESLWSYRGALCGLHAKRLQGQIATLDIGGGSTELSIGENGKYESGSSINIGAVRIKERFLSSYSNDSINAAKEFIRSELQHSFSQIVTDRLIAVAGTPTALAAMKLQLRIFDAAKVNSTTLSLTELSKMVKEILQLSPGDLVKKYPAVHADRADILPAGALILEETMKHLKLSELRVSTFGLRYGIMIREFENCMKERSDQWIVTP